MSEILKKHPKEIEEILATIGEGKLSDAKEAAAKIGIAEDNFTKQGGGMWAVITLAIACALLLEHD